MAEYVQKAIQIFEISFPEDIAVFASDNSSGHACKAKDALVANRMNLGPGGSQPIMHDTVFGGFIRQRMVYEEGVREWPGGAADSPIKSDIIGKPKGSINISSCQWYKNLG